MNDSDENKNVNGAPFEDNGEARHADKIDGNEYDYEKKYRETYAKYGFGEDRTEDKYGEYNTNRSYADMSVNEEQKWHGTKTGGWASFFRSFPFPMLCLVIYLIIGFAANAWHPGWIIFLSVPAYYSVVEYYATTGKIRFPLFSIVLIAYLLMGCCGGLWHPGWVVFFAWPLYFVFDTLMKIKHTRLIIYTFVCLAIYVVIGITLDLWHPGWIIFLTIPIFESLYASAKKLIEEKKEERAGKEKK